MQGSLQGKPLMTFLPQQPGQHLSKSPNSLVSNSQSICKLEILDSQALYAILVSAVTVFEGLADPSDSWILS